MGRFDGTIVLSSFSARISAFTQRIYWRSIILLSIGSFLVLVASLDPEIEGDKCWHMSSNGSNFPILAAILYAMNEYLGL